MFELCGNEMKWNCHRNTQTGSCVHKHRPISTYTRTLTHVLLCKVIFVLRVKMYATVCMLAFIGDLHEGHCEKLANFKQER